jgi:hypothetical protein
LNRIVAVESDRIRRCSERGKGPEARPTRKSEVIDLWGELCEYGHENGKWALSFTRALMSQYIAGVELDDDGWLTFRDRDAAVQPFRLER